MKTNIKKLDKCLDRTLTLFFPLLNSVDLAKRMTDPLVKSLRNFLQKSAASVCYNAHGKVIPPNMILRAEFSKVKKGGIDVNIMLPPTVHGELLKKTAIQLVHFVEDNQPTPPFVRVGKARVVLKATREHGQSTIDNSVAKAHRLSKSASIEVDQPQGKFKEKDHGKGKKKGKKGTKKLDQSKFKEMGTKDGKGADSDTTGSSDSGDDAEEDALAGGGTEEEEEKETVGSTPEIEFLKEEMLDLKKESDGLHKEIADIASSLHKIKEKKKGNELAGDGDDVGESDDADDDDDEDVGEDSSSMVAMGAKIVDDAATVHAFNETRLEAIKAERRKVMNIKLKTRKAKLRERKGMKTEEEEAWDLLEEKHRKEQADLKFDYEVDRAYGVHMSMTRFWRTQMTHEKSAHAGAQRRRKKIKRQLSALGDAQAGGDDNSVNSIESDESGSSSDSDGEHGAHGEGARRRGESGTGGTGDVTRRSSPTSKVAGNDEDDAGDDGDGERADPLADSSDDEKSGDADSRRRKMAHAVKRMHAGTNRFVDLREIAWKPEGRGVDPIPLNALNAQQFLAFKAGTAVIRTLRRQLHFPKEDVVMARSLSSFGFTQPTAVDAVLLRSCPYTRSFLYDDAHGELYVRIERLDSLGGYIVALIHIMAILKVRAMDGVWASSSSSSGGSAAAAAAAAEPDAARITAVLNYTIQSSYSAACGTMLESRSFACTHDLVHKRGGNAHLNDFAEQLDRFGFHQETNLRNRTEMISTLVHLGEVSMTMGVSKSNAQKKADLEHLKNENDGLKAELDVMTKAKLETMVAEGNESAPKLEQSIELHKYKLNLHGLKLWVAQESYNQMMGLVPSGGGPASSSAVLIPAPGKSSPDDLLGDPSSMNSFLARLGGAMTESESAYIDPRDAEWNLEGIAPITMDLTELSASQHVVYELGITLMSLLTNQIGFPVLKRVHIAVSLPEHDTSVVNKYKDNPYRRSFSFDEHTEELYVRAERLDSASGYIVMLLNVLAHLKAPPYLKCEFGESPESEHGQAFQREFQRSLRILFADNTAFRLLLNSPYGVQTRESFADMMEANGFLNAEPTFSYFNFLLSEDSRLEHVRKFAEQAAEAEFAKKRQELIVGHATEIEGFQAERREEARLAALEAGIAHVSDHQQAEVMRNLEADKLALDAAMSKEKDDKQQKLQAKLAQRTGVGYRGLNHSVHSSIELTLVRTQKEGILAAKESRMKALKEQLQEAETRSNKSFQVREDLILQLEQSLVRLEHVKICLCLFATVSHSVAKSGNGVTFGKIERFVEHLWRTAGLTAAHLDKTPRETAWMKPVFKYLDELKATDAKTRATLEKDGKDASIVDSVNSVGEFVKFQQAFSGKSASRICTLHLYKVASNAYQVHDPSSQAEMTIGWLQAFLKAKGLDVEGDVALHPFEKYAGLIATTGDDTAINFLQFQAAIKGCLSQIYVKVVAPPTSVNSETKGRSKETDYAMGSMRAELDWLYRSMEAHQHQRIWDGREPMKKKSLRVMQKQPLCPKATKKGKKGMLKCIEQGCKLMHEWSCEVKLGGTAYLGIAEKRKHKKGLASMVRVHGHLAAVHPYPNDPTKIENVSVIVTLTPCPKTKSVDHFECAPAKGKKGAIRDIKLRPPAHDGLQLAEKIRKHGTDVLKGNILERRHRDLIIRLTVPLKDVLPAVTHPSFVYTVGTRILVKGRPGEPYNGYCATVIGERKCKSIKKSKKGDVGEKPVLENHIVPFDPNQQTYINTDQLVFWFDNLGQVPSDLSDKHVREAFIPKPSNHILSTQFNNYQEDDHLIIYLPPRPRREEAWAGEGPDALTVKGSAAAERAEVDKVHQAAGRWVLGSVLEHQQHSCYKIQLLDETPEDGASDTIIVEQDLNEVNHFRNLLILNDYRDELLLYLEEIKAHATVMDGITGMTLDIGKQTVEVELEDKGNPEFKDVKTVTDLCERLAVNEGYKLRAHGQHISKPVLIKASAGTGKTWMTKQACLKLADKKGVPLDIHYVPFLVTVPELAKELQAHQIVNRKGNAEGTPEVQLPEGYDLLEWYINYGYKYDEKSANGLYEKNTGGRRKMLLDAYHSKRLLLLLDGLDEAPHLANLLREFVLTSLVAGSHRFLLTGRPEGFDAVFGDAHSLDRGSFGFAVLSLKPYSEEQQKRVLTNQSTEYGKEFMGHLLEFGAGLRAMDGLVERPTDESAPDYKTALADWEVVDVLHDTIRCGCNEHRQGFKIKKAVCSGNHTKDFEGNFRPDMFQNRLPVSGVDVEDVNDICTSYDDLRAVAEKAKEASDPILERIAAKHGIKVYQLKEGESIHDKQTFLKPFAENGVLIKAFFKGRERAEAKVMDKYDGKYAELQDMIRYSFICSRAAKVQHIYDDLEAEDDIDVVRTKNYFDKLDPTHYRRLGLTIRIPIAGTKIFHNGEVQVHFLPIWRDNPDHKHYEYFRSLFKGHTITTQLAQEGGGWLTVDKRVQSWGSFLKRPVLMALLVAVLAKLETLDIEEVPSTVSELYKDAIDIMVRRAMKGDELRPVSKERRVTEATVRHALAQLSFANHCPQLKRQFTTGDMRKALRSRSDLVASLSWCFEQESKAEYRVPTLKVLDDRGFESDDTSFHAVHLSLQEYLAAEYIMQELDPNNLMFGSDEDAEERREAIWTKLVNHSQFINNKVYNNMFQLASPKFAAALFGKDWNKLLQLTFRGIENLTAGNWSESMSNLRFTLDVAGPIETLSSGKIILDALASHWSSLTVLEIIGTKERVCFTQGTKRATTLHSAVRKHLKLRQLSLTRCTFQTKNSATKQYEESVAALDELVEAVCEAGSIRELSLVDCHLGHKHRETILSLLKEGKSLQKIDLHLNKLDLITRIELVTWMDSLVPTAEGNAPDDRAQTRLRNAIFDGDPARLRSAQRVHLGDPSETCLRLQGCTLQQCDTDWLQSVIRSRTSLIAVNLDNNMFAEASAECDAIGAMIISALAGSTVQDFSMCGAKLGTATVNELCKILSARNSRLSKLALSENPLGESACVNLVKALGKSKKHPNNVNQSLKSLELRNVKMTPKAGREITDILKQGVALHELDVSVNSLTSKGAIKIFHYMELGRHGMTKINFASNLINNHSSNEAVVYGRSLGVSNSTITELDISYNKIGWDALNEIVKNIDADKVLQKLNISGNIIKRSSAKLLKVALTKVAKWEPLTEVKVLDNQLSEGEFSSLNTNASVVIISGYMRRREPTANVKL